jgi:hypothetical protein
MELIDLLPPKERLGEVYRKFVSRLKKKLAEDEKRLDETFRSIELCYTVLMRRLSGHTR